MMNSRRIKPSKIQLVAFDLDGTLVNAFPAIADSINHMLKKMGFAPQSLYTVKRAVGLGVDNLISRFVAPDKAEEALKIFRAHHDGRLQNNISLLPGARTLLPFLKGRGCVLAIASNRPSKFCRIILKTLKVDHYFDQVIGGDAVKRAKPYPDMLKKILKEAKLKPAHALYVGDMTVDIECGRGAGVFTVAVPTGSCTRAELKALKPDMMIERLSQLRGLFKR
jgi:phosphoglycolate phosphatase